MVYTRKYLTLIPVVLLALLSSGCLTTLGAFRGARVLPTAETEVGVRGVTNGWAAVGVLSVRHGIGARTDAEGLVFAGGGEGETAFGAGLGITHQLPGEVDWLALGMHGMASGYRDMVGGRVLAGHNPYVGYERNYQFDSTGGDWLNMLLAGARVGENLTLEVGAFPIAGERDFFIHIGLGLMFPTGRPEEDPRRGSLPTTRPSH